MSKRKREVVTVFELSDIPMLVSQLAQARLREAELEGMLSASRSNFRNSIQESDQLRKDLKTARELCVRTYNHLGYWFSSLNAEQQQLFADMHKFLYMSPAKQALAQITEGKCRPESI